MTNKSVIATATLSEGTFKLQVSKDGTTWSDGNQITMDENGTFFVRALNGTTVVATATGNVTNIDKVAPSVNNIDTTIPNEYTSDVYLSFNATDDESGVKDSFDYSTDGASYTTIHGNSVTLTGLTSGRLYKVYIKIYDKAGNTSTSEKDFQIGEIPDTAYGSHNWNVVSKTDAEYRRT